jgi:predicted metal-dependent hydrolase
MPFVRFQTGPRKGESLALEENKIVFGRHLSCQCVLPHPTVSREHFFIERTGGKFFVVDNESGNGTFVNQERITWVELKEGDKIKVGPFILTFYLSDEDLLPENPSPSQAQADDLKSLEFDEEQELAYPAEYLEGITHFNAGRYFEAHEAWEEIWLHSSGDAKVFYQMMIQAAVGLYHHERNNARGARGMYNNVIEKLERLPSFYMSLNLEEFARQFKSFFAEGIENPTGNIPAVDKARPMIHLSVNDSLTDGL